ncbi:spirocyclase AveC family protein [Streptomyces syringium]|uniref:spirocyclase AveC family protein n=1 Tax=Streptomyces syringium TaxID=76729 RepID=UPI0034537FF8
MAITSNHYSLDVTSWGPYIPGWHGPYAAGQVDSVILTDLGYALLILWVWVTLTAAARVARWRPHWGTGRLVLFSALGCFVFDAVVEAVYIRLGAYAYPRTLEHFTLFPGHWYQLPLTASLMVTAAAVLPAVVLALQARNTEREVWLFEGSSALPRQWRAPDPTAAHQRPGPRRRNHRNRPPPHPDRIEPFGEVMTLTPADEFRHEPGPDPRWQETYWMLAWDDVRDSGVLLHLARLPHDGYVEAQFTVIMSPNDVVSFGGRYAVDDALAVPGLDVDIHTPLESWTMRYEGKGIRGADKYGLYAQAPGNVPFGFSVDFRQLLPAADLGAIYTEAITSDMAPTHYAAAATFTGTVWCSGQPIPISGLLTRDHSWGPREWAFDIQPGAVYGVLDEGRTLITTASCVVDQQKWGGFSVIHDENGTRRSGDPWWRVIGPPIVDGFREAYMRFPDEEGVLEAAGKCSIAKWTPACSSGPNILWIDMISSLRWGDLTGSGSFMLSYPSTSPLAAGASPEPGVSAPLPMILPPSP